MKRINKLKKNDCTEEILTVQYKILEKQGHTTKFVGI
jgi:hypothetical protein